MVRLVGLEPTLPSLSNLGLYLIGLQAVGGCGESRTRPDTSFEDVASAGVGYAPDVKELAVERGIEPRTVSPATVFETVRAHAPPYQRHFGARSRMKVYESEVSNSFIPDRADYRRERK